MTDEPAAALGNVLARPLSRLDERLAVICPAALSQERIKRVKKYILIFN